MLKSFWRLVMLNRGWRREMNCIVDRIEVVLSSGRYTTGSKSQLARYNTGVIELVIASVIEDLRQNRCYPQPVGLSADITVNMIRLLQSEKDAKLIDTTTYQRERMKLPSSCHPRCKERLHGQTTRWVWMRKTFNYLQHDTLPVPGDGTTQQALRVLYVILFERGRVHPRRLGAGLRC